MKTKIPCRIHDGKRNVSRCSRNTHFSPRSSLVLTPYVRIRRKTIDTHAHALISKEAQLTLGQIMYQNGTGLACVSLQSANAGKLNLNRFATSAPMLCFAAEQTLSVVFHACSSVSSPHDLFYEQTFSVLFRNSDCHYILRLEIQRWTMTPKLARLEWVNTFFFLS